MKIKYPRTFHLEWSEGRGSDDKILFDLSNFIGKEIVISEKMDGENSTLMRDYNYARSLDSNNHPSRNWLKGLWGKIRVDIPNEWRVCGENLYAKHSIVYNELDSYFMVFNIWNEHNVCISIDDTLDYCELLNLKHIPILYRGVFDLNHIKNFHNNLDLNKQEGFVIRIADSFDMKDFNTSVVKWVRKNHVNTSNHWTSEKIILNKLR